LVQPDFGSHREIIRLRIEPKPEIIGFSLCERMRVASAQENRSWWAARGFRLDDGLALVVRLSDEARRMARLLWKRFLASERKEGVIARAQELVRADGLTDAGDR